MRRKGRENRGEGGGRGEGRGEEESLLSNRRMGVCVRACSWYVVLHDGDFISINGSLN